MSGKDIVVGGYYFAKVNGRVVTVRVDGIEDRPYGYGSAHTAYHVTNTLTGRKTVFQSAAKFRCEASKKLSNRDTQTDAANDLIEQSDYERAEGGQGADPFVPSAAGSGPVAKGVKKTASPGGADPIPTQPLSDSGASKEDALRSSSSIPLTPTTPSTPPSSPVAAAVPPAGPRGKRAIGLGPTPNEDKRAGTDSRLAALLKQGERKASGDTAPHLVVEARAGTGKTFTIVVGVVNTFRDRVPRLWEELVRRLGFEPEPSPQQQAVWEQMRLSADCRTVKFCAFNKPIVVDFEGKWAWVIAALAKAGIDFGFSTMHSMGYKSVTKALGRQEPNQYVVRDLIALETGRDLRWLLANKPTVLKATEDLVSLCKMNLVGLTNNSEVNGYETGLTSDALDHLASHYEVDLNGSRAEVFDLVPRVLERCKQPQGKITFDDMIWLPVVLNLPVFRYDLLLVDEAQDLNRCQQALAKKAGRRLVLVGDPKQAIYGFAGADSESMTRMEHELNADVETYQDAFGHEVKRRGCITLPLTVTRRCGKAIVEEARKIVPDFEAHESNPPGFVTRANYGKSTVDRAGYACQCADGDLVLCRVNAPLVSQCFRFIKAGRKANIQGRDVGQGLVSLIKRLTKAGGETASVVDLVGRLSEWLHAEQSKEQAKRNPNENKLVALQDRHDCLLCFTEGATVVGDVIRKIESVFTDDKNSPGIRLSSIHKAKGLEAKRVFLLEPDGATVPHPMAKSAWQREQEMNLRYVAITRAIEELVYVS